MYKIPAKPVDFFLRFLGYGDNFGKLRFVFENDALRLKMREHFVLRIIHITSQSFVQSYRRFERNSYVHTSSTSDTAGIGFPHHYSHSYFYRVS